MSVLDDLKLFDEWYKLVAAAGAALAVPAITVGNAGALCCGIGLVLFGVGEFINHPYRARIIGSEIGALKAFGRPRDPRLFGLLLDGIGLGLFGWGVWVVVAASLPSAK